MQSILLRKHLAYSLLTCLTIGCSWFPNDSPCTQVEAKVLSAITFGDTAVLDAYLKTSRTFDFECRRHDDPLRSGEGLFWNMRETKHASILRIYLKYPIPSPIKDKLLTERINETSESDFLQLLIKHDAHLEDLSTSCQDYKAPRFLATMDTLGYDFNWVSPMTGNNILMDYCACTDGPAQFQDEFKDVIRFLVKKGVPVDIKNHDGETAIDIAKRSGNWELLREAEKERP